MRHLFLLMLVGCGTRSADIEDTARLPGVFVEVSTGASWDCTESAVELKDYAPYGHRLSVTCEGGAGRLYVALGGEAPIDEWGLGSCTVDGDAMTPDCVARLWLDDLEVFERSQPEAEAWAFDIATELAALHDDETFDSVGEAILDGPDLSVVVTWDVTGRVLR